MEVLSWMTGRQVGDDRVDFIGNLSAQIDRRPPEQNVTSATLSAPPIQHHDQILLALPNTFASLSSAPAFPNATLQDDEVPILPPIGETPIYSFFTSPHYSEFPAPDFSVSDLSTSNISPSDLPQPHPPIPNSSIAEPLLPILQRPLPRTNTDLVPQYHSPITNADMAAALKIDGLENHAARAGLPGLLSGWSTCIPIWD
ncbi:hypothetical protein MMC21_003179 [Puttea exsequens]|nr:hypothetical protein [Puttea exsequens]